MSSAANITFFITALLAFFGSLGVWVALRRPLRSLERRQRNEALAAAGRYTPAVRVSPYGSPEPRAHRVSDAERVHAVLAMLKRGNQPRTTVIEGPAAVNAFEVRDDPVTTSPMAWHPTLPPAQLKLRDPEPNPRQPRVHEADHPHLTVF